MIKPKYIPKEPAELMKTKWFITYLNKAVLEYKFFLKFKLPDADLIAKLKYAVAKEIAVKRKGYYFSISFLDETCKICKKCSRPLVCDNPISRPSWKLLQVIQKLRLRDGEGVLFIGPHTCHEDPLKNYDIDLDVRKIAKEIEEKYALKVYLLPAREVVVTWMTVLQCMYGCRVYSSFSRRWSCVPFCPNPDETKKIVSDYKFALILNKTYKPPLFNASWLGFNPLRDLDQKIWATHCYGEINSITLQVERLLMSHGFDVYAYGMSPCHACIKCSYPKPCKKPDKLRFSADACGIDIYATARKAGANFEVPPRKEINLFEIVLIR